MLFITNRLRKCTTDTSTEHEYQFNLEVSSPCNHVFFCIRTKKNSYREIGSEAFIKKITKAKANEIVFFFHGFRNLPEREIFPRVKKIQKHLNYQKKNHILVIPVIWPCDNDLIAALDYWDDKESAHISKYSIARMFQKIIAKDGLKNKFNKNIHILAHSMGNRVLKESLYYLSKSSNIQIDNTIFKNCFLVAPDISNSSLNPEQKGYEISRLSEKVYVYYAQNDAVLYYSDILQSKRLGKTGFLSNSKPPSNIVSIDCSDISDIYDKANHHTYFLDDPRNKNIGVVLKHIFDCVTLQHAQTDLPTSTLT